MTAYGSTQAVSYTHLDVYKRQEYNIEKQSSHFNLMDYELANIISLHKNEFVFYNYNVKGKVLVALTLKSLKSDFLSSGIIRNTDIVDFDINKFVLDTYDKYNK